MDHVINLFETIANATCRISASRLLRLRGNVCCPVQHADVTEWDWSFKEFRLSTLTISILAICFGEKISGEPMATQIQESGPFASTTPKYAFADTLDMQEVQLKNNPLIRRFAESRKRLASNAFRPLYHFVSPETTMNDPNGLSYWQGHWHLFYQAYPVESSNYPPKNSTGEWGQAHWGHAVSSDLVHWRDMPYAIYPGTERQSYSGGVVVDRDRVVAFYPGIGSGQMVAVSQDPLLLNWDKFGPVKTDMGDSDIWKEGDTYFGLVSRWIDKYEPNPSIAPEINRGVFKGGEPYGLGGWPKWALWASKDLLTWMPQGDFLLGNTPFTDKYDDAQCPTFQRIGDKHILLFFSHKNGGQYFLGDYDEVAHKFKPYDHGRFNHGQAAPGGVFSPSAADDGNGGVNAVFSIYDAKQGDQFEVMSLPQRLTLGDDRRLRMQPVEAVKTLRGEHQHLEELRIPANRELVLDKIQGNVMELNVEIDPGQSHLIRLNILRSPNSEEKTSIVFYNYDPKLSYWLFDSPDEVVLDAAQSSTLPDVWPRSPEKATIRRKDGEALKLRIFIDRSLVEVFVNERQYLAARVYPGRADSLGVSVSAQGHEALLKKLDAWQMKSIWPYSHQERRN